MASTKRALGVCDVCGFEYAYRELKKNSYGLLVCPTDYEGKFDLKQHPQNRAPAPKTEGIIEDVRKDEGDVYVPVTTTDWLPSIP